MPNRVNAYIVSDPAGNCGYSWQDAIVMGKSCSGVGNSTWAHAAGDHLSLPHPFFGWEGFDWNFSTAAPESISGYPVEKTDTSNCYISGDRFCDTRPDYLNYRWSCNNDKESTQLQKDPDGVSFRSDATLIMGYSLDACTSRFTPEQIDAMRMNLMTEHSAYLQETDPGPSIPEDAVVELISPVDSQYAQYNNVVLNWEPVPNATYYTVQIGLSPTFPIYLYNATVYNTSTAVVTKSIPNNRVLYWRVRAYNEWDLCISDNQSSTGVFRTKNLTATNELERLTLVELSPNPVISGIPANLLIVNDAKMDVKVCVRDASGKCFYQEQMRFAPGEFDVDIPTLNLAAGFYILMLENEKGVIIKRMVVVQ
ncbi:MAG: T9SS type A sorting domain-containing protein [Lewinellaceae bacterium]|nr:T9SS type A sorting domain-containing protein [Lewinellaceae bacterium]